MSFYVLENPSSYDTETYAVMDYAPVAPVNRGEAAKCLECGGWISGLPWLPPYRVVLEPWTNRYGDIAFGPGDELLLSENFVEKIRDAGLSGLQVLGNAEVVKVKRRGGARPRGNPPSYFVAVAVISQTRIDLDASGAEFEGPLACSVCRGTILLRHDRVVVDEATWQGEDIFYARGMPGTIVTSQRYAEWHVQNQINTGVLVRSEEFSEDFYSPRPEK